MSAETLLAQTFRLCCLSLHECDRSLTTTDARELIGSEGIRTLLQSGFVVVDRVDAIRRGLAGERPVDLVRAASRQTGLPLRDVARLLDRVQPVPGPMPSGAAVDVVGSGHRRVVGAQDPLVENLEFEPPVGEPLSDDPSADPGFVVPGASSSDHDAKGAPESEPAR